MVVIEDVVAKAADLGKVAVTLHKVRLDIELEALLSPLLLVEAAKDKDMLAVDRHAHCQIAGSPSRLGVQVHHAPHIVIDVVHLDGIRNFLLVKLGPAREYVDILVGENAACSAITRHIQVRNTRPGVVLNVILLTSSVETLGVVSTDDED